MSTSQEQGGHKDGEENLAAEMGVEPKIGVVFPPKWMVKVMVPNPMNKWDDLGGNTPIFGNIHVPAAEMGGRFR